MKKTRKKQALVNALGIFCAISLLVPVKTQAFSNRMGDRDWKWPVPSATNISSCFPNKCGHDSTHLALDISDDYGSEIYASYRGIVVWAGTSCNENYAKEDAWCPCGNGYACLGNFVYIKHKYKGNVYISRYGHMQDVYVKQGDIVTTDTVIGTVGSTGSSMGSHVDFMIWEGSGKKRPDEEYLVDPFLNEFLEEAPVKKLTSEGCDDDYLDQVKELYLKSEN